MAEYYLAQEDLNNELNKFIDLAPGKELLQKYQSEILAALTYDLDQSQNDNVTEIINLWHKSSTPSDLNQILIGRYYMKISDLILYFLEEFIVSGLGADLIQNITNNNIGAAGCNVAITLYKLFTKINKLEDQEYCLYMHVVHHYPSNKEFSKDDINKWYYSDNDHDNDNDEWICNKIETCDICLHDRVDVGQILTSLTNKNLLKPIPIGDSVGYRFIE